MTNCEWLKSYYPKISKEQFNEIITEEIERQNRYRWHDLRTNPDDLPSFEHWVYIADGFGASNVTKGFLTNDGTWSAYLDDYITDVIAWKEIEPFDVKWEDGVE